MTNLVKTLDNAIERLQDVRKKLNIKRLSHLKDSVLESIKKDALCADHWRFDSTAEIMHNGEIVGYAKYSASVEVYEGMASDDYDVPNDPDEIEITLESASAIIYGQESRILSNVSDRLNDMLELQFGKQI